MLLATLLIVAAGCRASEPSSQPEPEPTARRPATVPELLAAVNVSVTVEESSLGATRAMADFGVGQDLRMVAVRIVEDLTLTVRLEADVDVTIAGPPRLCLTGPFWNPLDAGLSDRCWGDPDLGTVATDRFERQADGTIVLRAGQPVVIESSLARGEERCDYAPGEWLLEVDVEPVIEGRTEPRVELTKAPLTVPFEGDEALVLRPNDETRFCSYPAAVFTRQGEPPIHEP